MKKNNHIDEKGNVQMVDVADKDITKLTPQQVESITLKIISKQII